MFYWASVQPNICSAPYVPVPTFSSNSAPQQASPAGSECNFAAYAPSPPPPPPRNVGPAPRPSPADGVISREDALAEEYAAVPRSDVPDQLAGASEGAAGGSSEYFLPNTRSCQTGVVSRDQLKSNAPFDPVSPNRVGGGAFGKCSEQYCCARCYDAEGACCSLKIPQANVDAVPLGASVVDANGFGAALVTWDVIAWQTFTVQGGPAPEEDAPLGDGGPAPEEDDGEQIRSVGGGARNDPWLEAALELPPGAEWTDSEIVSVVSSTEPGFSLDNHGYMVTAYEANGTQVYARRAVYPSITSKLNQRVYVLGFNVTGEDGSAEEDIRVIRDTPLSYRFEGLEPSGEYSFSVEALTCAGLGERAAASPSVRPADADAALSAAFLDSTTTADSVALQAVRDAGLDWRAIERVEPVVNVTVHAISGGRAVCVRWSTASDAVAAGPAPEGEDAPEGEAAPAPDGDDPDEPLAGGGTDFAIYLLELRGPPAAPPPPGPDPRLDEDAPDHGAAGPAGGSNFTVVHMVESHEAAGRAVVSLTGAFTDGGSAPLPDAEPEEEGGGGAGASDFLVGIQAVDGQRVDRSRIIWGVVESPRDAIDAGECT